MHINKASNSEAKTKEGWIMFFVVWKRGLERVIDNTGFVSMAKAKAYAIRELPTGWSFSILKFGSSVKVGV